MNPVPTTYAAMQEGFNSCCVAGGHPADLCKRLGEEGFGMHNTDAFTEASQNTLCIEMDKLADSHDGWLNDKTRLNAAALAEGKIKKLDQTPEEKAQWKRDACAKYGRHGMSGCR